MKAIPHIFGAARGWHFPAWVMTLCLVALALLTLEFAVGRVLDSLWFARPTEIASVLVEWFGEGYIYPHLATTLIELGLGFAFGIAIAIALAMVLSSSRLLGQVAMPFIYAANSLPKVALIPMFILTLGVGLESKIAQVMANVIFIVFLNLYTGLTSLNPRLKDVLALMGASPREILFKVRLPASLAWLLLGMRISARYALAGAVIVELLTSNRGLGFLIAKATAQLEPAQLFATIAVLSILGLAITLILQALENALMSWRV